jgi:uncharacterized delta-60 repeat protein
VAVDFTGTPATNPFFGTIVAAGYRDSSAFALARYRVNGDLDGLFDGDGKLTTAFPGKSTAFAQGVAIEPDGQIVATGAVANSSGAARDFGLARYNPDGTLDVNFGTDGTGRVVNDLSGVSDVAYDVVLGFGGKLLVAGEAGGNFTVARYTTLGVLDPTFSGDGVAGPDIWWGPDKAVGLAVAPGGKVVAGGVGGATAGGGNAVLARFLDFCPTVGIVRLADAAEGGSAGSFRVFRDQVTNISTRVYFSLGGTATYGSDYSFAPATARYGYVDIPAGQASVLITVTPVDDAVWEGTESVTLTLQPGIAYDLGTSRSATVAITDNDMSLGYYVP